MFETIYEDKEGLGCPGKSRSYRLLRGPVPDIRQVSVRKCLLNQDFRGLAKPATHRLAPFRETELGKLGLGECRSLR